MPDAGWYDDPLVPGGRRWWDGERWTEAVQAPELPPAPTPRGPIPAGPTGGPPPMAGAPPFDPMAAARPVDPNRLNDIGDWLGRTFRVLFQQIGPVALVMVAFPLPFVVVTYVLFDQFFRGLVWSDATDDFSGFSAGLLVAGIVAGIVTVLAFMASILGGHHLLYGAHVGRPPAWTESLAVGWRRLPRYLGLVLMLGIGSQLIFAIPFVGIIFGAQADTGGGIIVAISVLLMLAAFVALIYVSIRLAFISVTPAVVPAGVSALKAAWDATAGRFWAVLGRILLIGLITAVISIVVQLVTQIVATVVVFSSLEFGADGEFLVDGRPVDEVDPLPVADLLPNPAVVIIFLVLASAAYASLQAISVSATSSLYADTRGPNSFGHGAEVSQVG